MHQNDQIDFQNIYQLEAKNLRTGERKKFHFYFILNRFLNFHCVVNEFFASRTGANPIRLTNYFMKCYNAKLVRLYRMEVFCLSGSNQAYFRKFIFSAIFSITCNFEFYRIDTCSVHSISETRLINKSFICKLFSSFSLFGSVSLNLIFFLLCYMLSLILILLFFVFSVSFF